MALPPDFQADLWLDPLTFQGLIGASIAQGSYLDLFRPEGFAKSEAELRRTPWIAAHLDRESA